MKLAIKCTRCKRIIHERIYPRVLKIELPLIDLYRCNCMVCKTRAYFRLVILPGTDISQIETEKIGAVCLKNTIQ